MFWKLFHCFMFGGKSRLYSYVESASFLSVQVNALLPSNMFLVVIRGLFNHKLPTVRRKAMELLNTRLQHQGSFFSFCSRETLYSLLTPLLSVMGSIGSDSVKPDLETNQQVAMLSVKLLARHLAPANPSQFKQVNCCSVSWNKYVHEFIKAWTETVWQYFLSSEESIAWFECPQLCPLVLLTVVVLRWWWVWATGGITLTGNNWSTQRTPAPFPLFLQQISLRLSNGNTFHQTLSDFHESETILTL